MKKLMLLLAFIFILFQSMGLNAQTATEKYNKDAIYLQMGFWGPKYIKNGQSYRINLFNDRLYEEMKVSKEAMFVYKKYKKSRTYSLLFIGIGTGLMFSAIVNNYSKRSYDNDPYDPTYHRNRKIDAVNLGLIGLGVLSDIISLYYTFKANNQLHESIWVRNKGILEL